jgi:hypothetical protein
MNYLLENQQDKLIVFAITSSFSLHTVLCAQNTAR